MKPSEAYIIFFNINSDKFIDDEKKTAISVITNMATHNGVKKSAMLDVIRWLLAHGEVAT